MRSMCLATFLLACIVFLNGCWSCVSVDRRPALALPFVQDGQTNSYQVVDQGWSVRYSKWGFDTEVEEMSASISPGGTVDFSVGKWQSRMAVTNSVRISLSDVLSVVKLLRESGSLTNGVLENGVLVLGAESLDR